MFYPLNNNESVKCLSPKKFFNSDMTEQNIVGFACSYEELEIFEKDEEKLKAICDDDEDEGEEKEDCKLFDCEFILDLDKKKLIYLDTDNSKNVPDKKKLIYLDTDNSKNVPKISEYVKKIISSNKDYSSIFEKSLKKLYNNLNEIAFKLTYGNKNQVIPDYFSQEIFHTVFSKMYRNMQMKKKTKEMKI